MDRSKKPSPGLVQRTLSGFMWILLGSGVQVVCKVGVLAVLARLVSPEDFGLMGVALIVMDFSKMFTQMGVGPAIVQRRELSKRHLTTGLTLSVAMGAVFGVLLVFMAPYLAGFFRMPVLEEILPALAFVFLIDSFTLIAQALLQRNMRFKVSSGIEVISYVIGYGGVGILLGYLGWGVWALVAAKMAQSVMLTVLMLLAQPFPKTLGFDTQAFKELLLFGGGFTIAKIANFFATQGDNLVVGRMLGASALGIYGRAYQFMVMPAGLFGNALDRALFPAMAKVQDDRSRLAKAYSTGVSMIALIAIPVSFFAIILAPEIVNFLLGADWAAVVVPFQILSGSLLFRMSYKMSDSLARATGAVYRRAWRQVIYATMVLAGTYVGQFWGLPGVAYAVALALVTNFLLMAQMSLHLTGLGWAELIRAHKPGIIVGALTGGAVYGIVALCRLRDLPDFVTLGAACLTAGIILLVTFILLPGVMINLDLKEFYQKIIPERLKPYLLKNA